MDTLLPSRPVATEYGNEAITRAHLAREVARAKLSASQTSQKIRYDRSHRSVSCSPGTLVLLWSPSRRLGLSQKLLWCYNGPYRVLRQVTDVTYEISPVLPTGSPSGRPSDIVHVTRLKPYHAPTPLPAT